MMNTLIGLGLGILTFAILLGTGLVVTSRFQGSVAICPTASTQAMAYNYTLDTCANSSGATETPTGAAYTGVNYMQTQLGSSGLAGWTGAIIALAVGLMFLGGFLLGKGNRGKGRY